MIFIIGGTGKIGSEVIKQLAAASTPMTVYVRNPSKVPSYPNVNVVQGELTDKVALSHSLKTSDKMFLVTRSFEGSKDLQNNIIDTAEKEGVKHVVRISVNGADIKSPVTLGKWHAETDNHLKASRMKWTLLQPGMFMQNLLGSADSIKKDGAFYGANGKGKVAAIDARDIAHVAVKALTTPGHENKSYTLTGAEAISNDELAAKLTQVLGKSVKYVDVPPEQFEKNLLAAGLPAWLAADYVTMAKMTAAGFMGNASPDLTQLIGKARTYDDFLKDFSLAFK